MRSRCWRNIQDHGFNNNKALHEMTIVLKPDQDVTAGFNMRDLTQNGLDHTLCYTRLVSFFFFPFIAATRLSQFLTSCVV